MPGFFMCQCCLASHCLPRCATAAEKRLRPTIASPEARPRGRAHKAAAASETGLYRFVRPSSVRASGTPPADDVGSRMDKVGGSLMTRSIFVRRSGGACAHRYGIGSAGGYPQCECDIAGCRGLSASDLSLGIMMPPAAGAVREAPFPAPLGPAAVGTPAATHRWCTDG
jgi:hypothetical protein